jgi:hypothetical protein
MRGARPDPETLRLPLGRPPARRIGPAAGIVATLLVGCAIAVAIVPLQALSPAARAVLACVLVLLAAASGRLLGRRRPPSHGWLVLDASGLHRVPSSRRASAGASSAAAHGAPPQNATLVEWSEPFGFTVLASADRAKLLLALTSPRSTRYVPAAVLDADDAAAAPNVLERATTVAMSDLPASDDSALSAADAERLLTEISRRAPASVERMYLSDALGQAVVLDRSELRVGARRIDLSAPLEWRATLFQERGALAASVCQATWVNQGDVEIALVSPLPADGAWMGDVRNADVSVRAAGGGPAAMRSVARDLRLIQASADVAPPRDVRHAIDRVFMLPLRRVLDRAPRASRVATPPPRPMPEGRA